MSAAGHKVIFAGNERQRAYIKQTFPELTSIHLDGYNVTYSKARSFFMVSILKQLPKLISTIKKEHQWLQQAIEEYNISAVISDNRYGLYSSLIPCSIMTHQLRVLSGLGDFIDDQVKKLHENYLSSFNECWIVDEPNANLAGKLSQTPQSEHVKYLGLLSQLKATSNNKDQYLLVLLSGPEPQRTMLSDIIWEQLSGYGGNVVFVEGSPNAERANIPENVQYHSIVAANKLDSILSGASMVICRSGYSTIMDLVKLKKKAVLIPTPGQTEQEYLAQQLYEKGCFIKQTQANFRLKQCLQESNTFPFKNAGVADEVFTLYKEVITNWLNRMP